MVYPLWPMVGLRNGTRRTNGIRLPSYHFILHLLLKLKGIGEAIAQYIYAVLDIRSSSSLRSLRAVEISNCIRDRRGGSSSKDKGGQDGDGSLPAVVMRWVDR